MLVREQRLDLRQPQKRGKEVPRHLGLEQPVAVVREHRRMPHRAIERQADKPAEQQVVVDLLHQHPLGAHREEGLQQRRPQQHLGRDPRPAHRRVQRLEAPVQRRQSLIRQPADRPQRVIRRNALLQPHVGEQPIRPIVPPAHAKSPPWLRSRITGNPTSRDFFSSLLVLLRHNVSGMRITGRAARTSLELSDKVHD